MRLHLRNDAAVVQNSGHQISVMTSLSREIWTFRPVRDFQDGLSERGQHIITHNTTALLLLASILVCCVWTESLYVSRSLSHSLSVSLTLCLSMSLALCLLLSFSLTLSVSSMSLSALSPGLSHSLPAAHGWNLRWSVCVCVWVRSNSSDTENPQHTLSPFTLTCHEWNIVPAGHNTALKCEPEHSSVCECWKALNEKMGFSSVTIGPRVAPPPAPDPSLLLLFILILFPVISMGVFMREETRSLLCRLKHTFSLSWFCFSSVQHLNIRMKEWCDQSSVTLRVWIRNLTNLILGQKSVFHF